MKELNFKTPEEFEKLFSTKSKELTDVIIETITEAVKEGKKSAAMFQVSFDNTELSYEISLPAKQWNTALENCLKHYEELNCSDECIDTWQLISKLKKNKL